MQRLAKVARAGLIAALVGLFGCTSSTPTFHIHTGHTEGVSYEIRGSGHVSESRSANGDIEATLGSNRLAIKGGHVLANGKNYGPVKKGDEVVLDATGQVSLNGKIVN